MAAQDDHMYYETLTELVYDDKKVVTYKGLSALLGVHVNMAKQMLYTFYTREKNKGKNVHALMFVSGIAGPKPSEGADSNGSTSDTIEKHCIVLCHDTDLLKTKATYKKLYSIHVYSVSAFPVTDYSILQQKSAVVTPIEEANPATYGPFKIHLPAKDAIKAISISTPHPVKIESKPLPAKMEKPEPEAKGKANSDKKPNMFAAFKSSAKPTPVKKEVEDIKPKISPEKEKEVEKKVKENGKNKKLDAKGKSSKRSHGHLKADTSRKRSRIIMQSESDSDEDEQPANKRSVFESSDDEAPVGPMDLDDSDEEAPKTNGTVKLEPVQNEPASKGKRKVAKTISHTYMDDEGFVVTRKEQVMVSEDEDDGTNSKIVAKNEVKEIIIKSPKKPATTNGNTKPTKSNDIVAKKKQSSIMSFFTKKN